MAETAPPPTVGTAQLVQSLSLGGPVFLAYSSKVDAIIVSAIAACYGEFVTLTQPIILQSTINSLAGECHSLFPLQCTAISTLLVNGLAEMVSRVC
jgi:hypothetical protein